MADNPNENIFSRFFHGISDTCHQGAVIGEAAARVNSLGPGGLPTSVSVPLGKVAGVTAGCYIGPYYSAGRIMGLWK